MSEPGFAGLPDFQINGMNAFWHSPGLEYGALDCHSKVNINAYQKNVDAAILVICKSRGMPKGIHTVDLANPGSDK